MNNSKLQEYFEQMLEALKNGSSVSGDNRATGHYREQSLESAFYIATQDILPILVNANLVTHTDRIANLADPAPIMQKHVANRKKIHAVGSYQP